MAELRPKQAELCAPHISPNRSICGKGRSAARISYKDTLGWMHISEKGRDYCDIHDRYIHLSELIMGSQSTLPRSIAWNHTACYEDVSP